MQTLDFYCQKALEMGMNGAKLIDPHSVATAPWVRMKCQFGCPEFGKRLTCPPHTPTPDQTRKIIDSYEKAILLHFQYQRTRDKERARGVSLNETVVRLEGEMFLDGYYKAWGMGGGFCRLCKECDPNGLCRHGSEARPSMEACGIDVYKTARDNEFRIEPVRTHEDERNFYGLILAK